MDLNQIKMIVNTDLEDSVKKRLIITVIANDEKAIPDILEILNHERHTKNRILTASNFELSRALVTLRDKNIEKIRKKVYPDPVWVSGEIFKHYKKWKDFVGCTFRIDELDKFIENGND